MSKKPVSSRSLPPLENGVPPSPTYPPSARRLRNCRTNASRTRSVAKSAPMDRKSVSERIILSASSAGASFSRTASRADSTCSISFRTSSSSIEQTFDTRFRPLRNAIAVRLPHRRQLLAAISSQSLVYLYPQRRQNAVDLVDDRSPLPGQILPFPIRTPRFLIGLARDRNHRTDPRLASQPSHQSARVPGRSRYGRNAPTSGPGARRGRPRPRSKRCFRRPR